MSKKQEVFDQFKQKMQDKYGMLSNQETREMYKKLVSKKKVDYKDLKQAEEEIKALKTPDKVSPIRINHHNYKTIDGSIKLNLNKRQRGDNNSTSCTFRKDDGIKDKKAEHFEGYGQKDNRAIGSKSELKHRQNSKSIGNGN